MNNDISQNEKSILNGFESLNRSKFLVLVLVIYYISLLFSCIGTLKILQSVVGKLLPAESVGSYLGPLLFDIFSVGYAGGSVTADSAVLFINIPLLLISILLLKKRVSSFPRLPDIKEIRYLHLLLVTIICIDIISGLVSIVSNLLSGDFSYYPIIPVLLNLLMGAFLTYYLLETIKEG